MSTETTPAEKGNPAKPDWALTRREKRAKERADAGLPPRQRRGWILWLVLALAVAGAVVWYQQGGAAQLAALRGAPEEAPAGAGEGAPEAQTEETVEQVMQLLPSELTEVQPARLRETVKATGALSPVRQLAIPAEVSARVTEVLVREGEAVEAGQLLVQLDVETLRNQLDQQRATAAATRAQLRLARTQLERTQSLVARGLAPESQLEAGRAEVDQIAASLAAQEKSVANAEENLKHAHVTAPFSGVISDRTVDPGAYVSTGSPLVSLVDLSSLEFEAAVPVRYTPLLAPGQRVELSVEGVTARDFSGTVDRISPVAIEGTRMLPVYVTLANPEGLLRGGMFAAGRIVLEQLEGALGIPADALREDSEGTFVLKREGDRVIRQPVTLARTWEAGALAEITQGLAPGDVIVAQPLDQLRPGSRILVVGEDQ
ncbi:efflux RND transporter periplasmic adaptor subunit [Pseudooceanicola sp. 200-1SW]|uniref:efflux RND transporter periplasmic adaptor subunit n=1 Tax=Pseudooceanicola sp. 200-1SW TaxID=3425949 RepID=UPI003D7F9B66